MDEQRLGRWVEISHRARNAADGLGTLPEREAVYARQDLLDVLQILAGDAVPELVREVRRLEREVADTQAMVLEATASAVVEKTGCGVMSVVDFAEYLRTTAKVIRARATGNGRP